MSAEAIRNIVDRCYATPTGILMPNALDQLNPFVPSTSSEGPQQPQVDPGDVVRNLVGRCYSDPIPNKPNPLDPVNPPPTGPPPETPDPPPTPPEIIRRLVERCYPDPPVIEPPPPDLPELPPPTRLDFPWIYWLIRWVSIPPPEVTITLDPPRVPGTPTILKLTRGDDDCELVAKYIKMDPPPTGPLRDLPDYEEERNGKLLKSPGWWEHTGTGEKFYCDLSEPFDPTWNECVRKAQECLFRQYLGAGWKPPKADCGAYWPNGWNGNTGEVCVENCFPDRIPIYESYYGTGSLSVQFDSSGNIVATGSGAVVVTLKLQWNDRPWTYGTAVDTISVAGKTFTRVGRSGEQVETIQITTAGTLTTTFTGLHAANSTLNIVDNNTRICMLDGHGSDCNANFIIVATNSAADHAYYSEGAKAGYTLTGDGSPGFYILREEIPGVTVKLFRFYSSLHTDTFLTTNPGEPDSPGTGERATMNASGMGGGEVIGHIFPTAASMASYLAEDEQAEALHRLWSPDPFDHKYTIDGDYAGGMPVKLPDYFAYRIPKSPKADISIQMDIEKGNSGYNNAVGFYLADETGPKYGRMVCNSARSGTEMYHAYVPNAQLLSYAGGSMGFFLVPDGGDENTFNSNQEFLFEPLNAPHDGGFRGTGINSAQSNYILFSDRRWNPNKKDQTKWQGKDIQMWEDLIDGDDDYNDLRFWHKLGWTFGGYVYEGIQGYTYSKLPPPKVMRKIDPAVKCDERILDRSFKDVMIRRMDCGVKLPTMTPGNDLDWECAECKDDNRWYVNPATLAWQITDTGTDSSSNVTASFDASGNLVVGGSGTATITFSFSWSDNPGTYGTALGTYEITSLGISFTQGAGQSGSVPNQTATITAGQTYNCTITNGNAAGFDRLASNQTLCFKDADGTDCNATLSFVGGIEQTQQTVYTELTNSVTEKGSWVQVGASNNPGNPWTQHMIDYGIYPVVPPDDQVDPHIGTWQIHTATFTSAGGDYFLKIETDNYGYIKITDPGGSVIVDTQIDYANGFGSQTLFLQDLSAGNYTLETRVQNYKWGAYPVRLNTEQAIKAAPNGGTMRFISMGGITGGIFGSCMTFTLRMKKKDSTGTIHTLFTEQYEADHWPRIGGDLWDQDIVLSGGDATADPVVPPDELIFEFVSIDSGPVTGDISLECGFYNTEEKTFDGVFKLHIGTHSGDMEVGSNQGNPTNNPQAKEGGEVEGFALAFRPTNRGEWEWEPGSKYNDSLPNPAAYDDTIDYLINDLVTNASKIYRATSSISSGGGAPTHSSGTNSNWQYVSGLNVTWAEDNVPDPGFPYTYVWANNQIVLMHGSKQLEPDVPGNTRLFNNPLLPNIQGGYIDTGYLYDKSDYFSETIFNGQLPSYNYRKLTGCYNHLVEDFLITKIDTLSGTTISNSQNITLSEFAPSTFARASKSWYVLGSDGQMNKWYVNPACIAWRITEGSTQIATSVEHKGDWVKIDEPNNPGNGWTQHMIDYGIYRVKPDDDQIDPYIGEWQTHTATVNFPNSTTYSMRIESDNWGWLKITNSSNSVIYDGEVTYTNGAGGQTIPLTLASGDYTIETRVKNRNVQGGTYQDTVDNIWNGNYQSPVRDTYYSPTTFIHDYTLDNYHGTGGSNYADACKIRIGITFYPITFDKTTGSKQVHYWQALINVIDVIDKGKGYAKGSEFVLTWPPIRDKNVEDPETTPYYPDQRDDFAVPSNKILAWWENEDLVRRTVKEAFYQESHNKDSVVWYSATDKARFRVKFKVTLTQVTDPP